MKKYLLLLSVVSFAAIAVGCPGGSTTVSTSGDVEIHVVRLEDGKEVSVPNAVVLVTNSEGEQVAALTTGTNGKATHEIDGESAVTVFSKGASPSQTSEIRTTFGIKPKNSYKIATTSVVSSDGVVLVLGASNIPVKGNYRLRTIVGKGNTCQDTRSVTSHTMSATLNFSKACVLSGRRLAVEVAVIDNTNRVVQHSASTVQLGGDYSGLLSVDSWNYGNAATINQNASYYGSPVATATAAFDWEYEYGGKFRKALIYEYGTPTGDGLDGFKAYRSDAFPLEKVSYRAAMNFEPGPGEDRTSFLYARITPTLETPLAINLHGKLLPRIPRVERNLDDPARPILSWEGALDEELEGVDAAFAFNGWERPAGAGLAFWIVTAPKETVNVQFPNLAHADVADILPGKPGSAYLGYGAGYTEFNWLDDADYGIMTGLDVINSAFQMDGISLFVPSNGDATGDKTFRLSFTQPQS